MYIREGRVEVRKDPPALFQVRGLELDRERLIRAVVVLAHEAVALQPPREGSLRDIDVSFRQPQCRELRSVVRDTGTNGDRGADDDLGDLERGCGLAGHGGGTLRLQAHTH